MSVSVNEKHHSLFSKERDIFLEQICGKLQISETQYLNAETHYKAIGEWLDDSKSFLSKYKPVIYPQGSLRLGTTVKPLNRHEYDLDIVCEFKELDWKTVNDPLVLLEAIKTRLSEHGIYKTMLEPKNRCIRVNYKSNFHLDILPACPDYDLGNNCLKVPDRKAANSNEIGWKESNPLGYAEWFESRTHLVLTRDSVEPFVPQIAIENHPILKKVVQLIKRRRDIVFANKIDQAPISIVLTTLAATHYRSQSSLFYTIKYILDGIVNSLFAAFMKNQRIIVLNPANNQENLSERWDKDEKLYHKFVEWVIKFQEEWKELETKKDIELVNYLKYLFGEQPVKEIILDRAKEVSQKRLENDLGIIPTTGAIVTLSGGNTVPIPKNTFYGK